MDFRDFMKEKGGEAKKPQETPTEKKIEAEHPASNRLQAFEKIFQSTLSLVQKIWEQARQDQPIDYVQVIQCSENLAQFLLESHDGVRFFKKENEVPYFYVNVVNVALFSMMLGIELQFKEERLVELGVAALLHDVGMSKIDPAILTKKEKLSFDEYELIRQHPEQGKLILSSVEGVSESILQAVKQEHERENGSGYPEGVRGDQIHEYAKIIGLADVFEAMTHHRDYRDPISANEAIMEVLTMKGRLFNDKYIKCFINTFTFYPVGSYVQLNTNEVGRVIQVDKKSPTRPTVELLIDRDGMAVSAPQFLGLLDKDLIFVKEALTEEKVRFALEGNG